MTNRFDYVKYDEEAQAKQTAFKASMTALESQINALLDDGRSKFLALTKAEELFLWIGKAIRDDQIDRNILAALHRSHGDVS